jgi:DNA-directed RNA polymerase specialized sigma24 family protein
MGNTRSQELVTELYPLIERVAKNIASDYPDVDWEDIRSGLCIFVMQNAESIKTREEGGNPNWLLKRVAGTLCKEERAQQHRVSVQYSYRPSDVSKILETAFSVESLDKTHVPEDAESMKSGADEIEVASDIRDAYNRLPDDLKVAIFTRYALGEVPDNASYERKKLNKAIRELTRIVNSYRGKGPFTATRRAISNSAAQSIIRNYY